MNILSPAKISEYFYTKILLLSQCNSNTFCYCHINKADEILFLLLQLHRHCSVLSAAKAQKSVFK